MYFLENAKIGIINKSISNNRVRFTQGRRQKNFQGANGKTKTEK